MARRNELPIPGAADNDGAARELIRVWAAAGSQHVSLAPGVWKDPAAWGIVLVDLARHLAVAYEQTQGLARADVLGRIREAFEAEWTVPTDEGSSSIVGSESGGSPERYPH